MSNKILGSLSAKVIGVLLLCVLGAYIMFDTIGILYLQDRSYPDGLETYTDTLDCDYQAQSISYNVINLYTNYNKDAVVDTYSFGDFSNLYIDLAEYDSSTKKYSSVCNNSNGIEPEQYVSFTYYITRDENSSFTLYTSEKDALKGSGEDIDSIYRINLLLETPMTVHDQFYQANQIFNAFYFKGISNLFRNIIINAVLFILVLIFEFSAAGHKNGYEGVHQIWLDQIPYELILFYLFAMTFKPFFLSFPLDLSSSTLFSIYSLIALAMYISLNIYLVLMTTARRLKANTFFESTITYHILVFVYRLIKAIPVVYRISIPAILYLIYEFLLSIRYIDNTKRFWIHMVMVIVVSNALILLSYQFSFIYKAGKELVNGNKNYKISDKNMKMMVGELKEHAENLNELSDGISLAVDKEMKSERLKAELITNVSHDIKTPLTSIINYTNLLSKDHTPEEEKQYIDVLNRQSNKLKKLIEDLIEASKASTGNVATSIVPLNIRELMEQSIAEYDEKLKNANLEVVLSIKDEPISVLADGRLLWRVLSNLFSNVSKYALSGTRVYIDVARSENHEVCISIKNISKEQLNILPDELTERFVRGDSSRHTEGSGLGLNIVKSLVEVQKGRFVLDIDGDLFKALIYLPENVE